MSHIIIFGASDAAELAHHYFTHNGVRVAAFVVDAGFKKTDSFCGLPVVETTKMASLYPSSQFKAFVAIGYSSLNSFKKQKYLWMKEQGYSLVSYVSPNATVLTKDVGDNCFIQEGCVVQPQVKIGNNVTLWSGVHVGHHSVIEDHCFFAPRACLAGRVTVKERSFIGTNATIKDHVTLEKETLVAAGALVVSNTAPQSLHKSPKAQASALKPNTIKNI